MHELGRRTGNLPAPPSVVWRSLVEPHAAGTRPWLRLDPGEVEPRVLGGDEPCTVIWSSLWSDRAGDEVRFRLTGRDGGTALELTLLTPHEVPGDGELGRLRRRLNVLLWADLRLSYGQ